MPTSKPSTTRRPSSHARALGMMAALGLVAVCGHASAQSRAEVLFREGRQAAEQKDWVGACAKFAESLSYENSVGALVNLGECNERQGKLVAALGYWRRGLERMAPEDARRDLAAGNIAELEKRTAKLVVMAPGDTRIFIDGQAALPGQPWLVDAGKHEVVVLGPGGPRTIEVTVREGEVRPVETAAPGPGAGPPIAPASSPSAEPPEEPEEVDNPLLVPAAVAYGVGGAGLVLFGITGILYLGEKSTVAAECDENDRCSDAGFDAGERGFTYGVANAVGLGVAVLGAGLGTTLLIVGSQQTVEAEARIRGTTVEISGSF